MRRRRTAVLVLVLVLTPFLALAGCTTTIPGTATPAAAPSEGGPEDVPDDGPADGSTDVDLDVAADGSGRLLAAFVDSAGEPVAVYETDLLGLPRVVRGTDPGEPVVIEEFGEYGFVEGIALTADDTLVMVGLAGADGDPAVVRVAPDDTVQVLPLTGAGAADDGLYAGLGAIGFSPDGSRAVLAWAVDDYTVAEPLLTGELAVWQVDTTTGEVDAPVRTRLTEPAVIDVELFPALQVRDVVGTPDGGAAVAVDIATDAGPSALLVQVGADGNARPPVTLQAVAPPDDPRFLAVDGSGAVLATVTQDTDPASYGGEDLRVLSLAPQATEPAVVATLPGQPRPGGLAVAPDGGRLYLTGITDPSYVEQVATLDRRTGEVGDLTTVCEAGYLGEPVVSADGEVLLVSAECDDGSGSRLHLYLLPA